MSYTKKANVTLSLNLTHTKQSVRYYSHQEGEELALALGAAACTICSIALGTYNPRIPRNWNSRRGGGGGGEGCEMDIKKCKLQGGTHRPD